MQSFEFYCPTKVVFGKDAELKCADLVKEFGGTKVLLHYGSKSAKESGLLDKISHILKQAGLSVVTLGGVVPNPRLSMVRSGIELCRKEGVDFIMALGGGSVIDSSKAIAIGLYNKDIDIWDYYLRKAPIKGSIPVGVILTVAAAGSETSNSSVITNEDGWIKRGMSNDLTRPKFAVMNPELTYSLPPYQTICGVTDIIMHTLDRYFAPAAENEMTDAIAEGLLRTIIKYGRLVLDAPQDYQIRSEIMWAGSLSHNTLTGLGRPTDFSVHQLGHELSGKFDVAHGSTLSTMWATWARYVYKKDIPRFARYAEKVWDIENNDLEQAAIDGINQTESYFASIGMPTSISQLIGRRLTDQEIDDLAEKCSFFKKRKIGVFYPADIDMIKEIYIKGNK
ncbi:MAG: iron-containing alcohol dehydrogenase [Bacillota bacterium]|jgi:alcohol dehydrogenase YqhD (iron-dependent ADH family)